MRTFDAAEDDDGEWTRRLLHRWFVQYNPVYLASAALVLVGLTLLSRALAHATVTWQQLVVPGVTELYAFALVGSAALLVRLGLRRPAVFVALVAVLYQGDLALTTETDALLGGVGLAASLAWWVLFVAKLRGIAWALRLELAPSAWIVPSLGALGIALVPHLCRRIDPHASTTVIALWSFVTLGSALWSSRRVTSRAPLDGTGRTVLRRAVRAAWWMLAGLMLAHVLFWIDGLRVSPAVFAPIAPLLSTRWMRREITVVGVVTATIVLVAAAFPEVFAATCVMSAIVFTVHALHRPALRPQSDAASHPPMIYRAASIEEDAVTPPKPPAFEAAPATSRARMLAMAVFALHLGVWTMGWRGGEWPAHALALDAAVSIAVATIAMRARLVSPVLPLLALYLHAAAQRGVVRAPQTILGWGAASVCAGFVLLLASLLASASARLPRRGVRQT
jgi:hypothetical protein